MGTDNISSYLRPGVSDKEISEAANKLRTKTRDKTASREEIINGALLQKVAENFDKVDIDNNKSLSEYEIKALWRLGKDGTPTSAIVALVKHEGKIAPPEPNNTVPPKPAKETSSKEKVEKKDKVELVKVIQSPAKPVVEIRNTTNPQLSLFGPYLIGDDKDDQRILFNHNVYGRIDLTRGRLTGDITQDQIDRAGIKVEVLSRGERNRPFAVNFTFTKPGIFELDGKKIIVPGIIELWNGEKYAVTDDGEILSKSPPKEKTLSKDDLSKEGGWQTKSKGQLDSNIRLHSPIPVVVKGGTAFALSNDYINGVNSGLASIPLNIQRFIQDQGYTIILTSRLVDTYPNQKPNDSSGFEDTAGITIPDKKEIAVAENIYDRYTKMYVKGFSYDKVTRHELGHAYVESSILMNPSLIEKLHNAYEEDLKYIAEKCTDAQKKSFAYLLPKNESPLERVRANRDACAEVFAFIYGGGFDTSDPVFDKAFSNLIKCVKEEIIDKQGKTQVNSKSPSSIPIASNEKSPLAAA